MLGALVWVTIALIASHIILSNLFKTAVENNFDDRLRVQAEEILSLVQINADNKFELKRKIANPRLNLPGSGWYWQITPQNGTTLRSRSLWDNTLPIPEKLTWRLGFNKAYRQDLDFGEDVHILSGVFSLPKTRQKIRILVAGPRTEIDRSIDQFNIQLVWGLITLGVGLMAAVFFQIQFGLRPLAQLGKALQDIQNDRKQRLDGQYPEEIKPVVTELNTVLDHSEQRIKRTRKEIGDLAHALKTPIAIIQNEADSISQNQEITLIQTQCQVMQDRIHYQLARARTAGTKHLLGSNVSIKPVLQSIKNTMEMLHVENCPTLLIYTKQDVCFRGDRQDLEEVMGNVIDNACKWANQKIIITAQIQPENLSITVDDDGLGLTPDQIKAALKRGQRFDNDQPGSGLGLAIAHDIVQLYQGQIILSRSQLGGLSVEITFPIE